MAATLLTFNGLFCHTVLALPAVAQYCQERNCQVDVRLTAHLAPLRTFILGAPCVDMVFAEESFAAEQSHEINVRMPAGPPADGDVMFAACKALNVGASYVSWPGYTRQRITSIYLHLENAKGRIEPDAAEAAGLVLSRLKELVPRIVLLSTKGEESAEWIYKDWPVEIDHRFREDYRGLAEKLGSALLISVPGEPASLACAMHTNQIVLFDQKRDHDHWTRARHDYMECVLEKRATSLVEMVEGFVAAPIR